MISLNRCRVCKSKRLALIGSLGDIAISDFTIKPSEGRKYPLTLVYCRDCTLLQLDKIVPRRLLYSKYWYQSHINPVIKKDLKEISKYVKGNLVCDIGANDGTFLSFVNKNYHKIAVDPSNIKPNGYAWFNTYWEEVKGKFKADTITAIACLYDLLEPNRFMGKIKTHLAEDGIFIAQLMTLQPMIENNDLGNICHEHIEYYSYKSLVTLYERHGLEIYEVQKNDINGGSYRIFARHYTKGSIKFKEKVYGLRALQAFFTRVAITRDETRRFLYDKQIYNIYGYGASTKANTILQYYGYPEGWTPLKGIVDVNPDKLGKFTIATNIPIIAKIPKDCDYLWCFPYGFIESFKKKERYKGKWVVSIPNFKIT